MGTPALLAASSAPICIRYRGPRGPSGVIPPFPPSRIKRARSDMALIPSLDDEPRIARIPKIRATLVMRSPSRLLLIIMVSLSLRR